MNVGVETVAAKTAAVIAWEKRKRREQAVAAAGFYALLAALAMLPLYGNFLSAAARWSVPLGLALLLAPGFLFAGRWRRSDSVRALARADRALELEERALTAWELSHGDCERGAALLVFKQAGEKLACLDAKRLFPRTWRWEALMAAPLLIVWSGLVWFNPRFETPVASHSSKAGVARELQKFSRELQAKAKAEKLRESLRLGQAVERLAQKAIDSKAADPQVKTELARVLSQFHGAGESLAESGSFAAAETRQSLADLEAELESARGFARLPPAGASGTNDPASWSERLAAMPQLQRRLKESGGLERRLGPKELQSFLDRLDRQVERELDRRELLDAEQFLQRMLGNGDGREEKRDVEVTGQGSGRGSTDLLRGKADGSLPGDQPGKNAEGAARLPEFHGGAPTRVEGSLGAGESAGMLLKAQPVPGKSKLPQEEIIASYRREAEADLGSEDVPETLKATIKRYFLSLNGQEQKAEAGSRGSGVGEENANGVGHSAGPDVRRNSKGQGR